MEPIAGALVGRDAELAALSIVVADRGSLPAAIVIEGEPGAGKTSVWREGIADAERAGYHVLRCRPGSAEVQLSFAALGDLLEDVLDGVVAALPAPQRRALEVALLLRDDDGHAPDQRAIAAGVLGSIRVLAGERPVLIAIDDAQWLDAPSAAVLEYAARRLGDAHVALLTAWRTAVAAPADAVNRPPRRPSFEVALDRAPLRLVLGPLSLGAIGSILRSRTDLAFNRRTLQRIHETAGGNPFYAIELATAIGRGRLASAPGEPLPLTVGLQELLADRLAGFGEATRHALCVAAAVAHPTVELVSAVIEQPAEAALEPAVEAGVLRNEADRLLFSHPLLAASAFALASPQRRRRWQARLAELVEDEEARARHLALARDRPDLDVAGRLRDAARHARQRGAVSAAAELYREAIEWLPPDAENIASSWVVEAAPALRLAGEGQSARALLESAITELPGGPLRADAMLQLSALVAGDRGGSDHELTLIEAALAEAGADPGWRAAALLHREMWERHRERLAGALPFAREAVGLAERAGDHHLLARALTRTADLEVLLGLADDPLEHFARALRAGEGLRFDRPDDSAPAMLAACLIRAGRVVEARTLLLEERDRAIAEGDEAGQEILCVLLAELEWLAGRWDLALQYATDGLEVAEPAGSRAMQGALLALIALVEASRGVVDTARTRALEALAMCEDVGDLSYALYASQILGFLELTVGDPAAAHRRLTTHPADGAIEGSKRLAFVGDEVEALIRLGQVAPAASLVEQLEVRGRELKRATLTGSAARGRGLVLGSRGAFGDALVAAEQAVETFSRLGLPFERARSLLVLGEIQRRAKHRAAARETLREARSAFDALGAGLWSERARGEEARIGGRTAVEGLTETELRVAQLVARGLTNKEIAAELFVTVRAVEANLSRIYAKLDIRSRTELARRI